jgi:hypothetical protein
MSTLVGSALTTTRPHAPALVGGDSPLDVAATTFRLLTTGPEPLSLDGAALGGGLPARRIPLSELAAILMHPSCDFATSDRVWRLLIDRARTEGPAWVVGAVGVALPGLRQAARRMRHTQGDVQAELLTAFVTTLRTVRPSGAKVARRLLTTTVVAARAALRGQAVPEPVQVEVPSPTAGHPDLILDRAVAAGVITATAANLIGATRLEDVSVADYAARVGKAPKAVYKARDRAEERLVAAIRSGALSDEDATVIAEATMTLAPHT